MWLPIILFTVGALSPGLIKSNGIPSETLILGRLKAALVFSWHSGIAYASTLTNHGGGLLRFGRVFETAAADS